MEAIFVTCSEAARLLSLSEPTLKRRLRAGDIPSISIGRLRRVPLAALQALASSVEKAPDDDAR